MTDVHTADTQRATTQADSVVADRRRPGRPGSVSPALIPLLRDPQGAAGAPTGGGDAVPGAEALAGIADMAGAEEDDLNAVRGIGVGLVLAAPFWATILYVLLR